MQIISSSKKLKELRRYQGTFTGKVVKPVDDEKNLEKLEEFRKGEIVWVLKDSDFRDFVLLFMIKKG